MGGGERVGGGWGESVGGQVGVRGLVHRELTGSGAAGGGGVGVGMGGWFGGWFGSSARGIYSVVCVACVPSASWPPGGRPRHCAPPRKIPNASALLFPFVR